MTNRAYLRSIPPTGTKREVTRKVNLAAALLSIRFFYQFRTSDGEVHQGTSRFNDYPCNWALLDMPTKTTWWRKTILARNPNAIPADAELIGVQIHSSQC